MKTGDSLQYAFIEFENVEDCESAYLKMDNVLIDERRIHVDFSQSVAKQWLRWKRDGKWANKQDTTTQYLSDLDKAEDPRWEEKKVTYMNKWAYQQRAETKREVGSGRRRNSSSSSSEKGFKKPKVEYAERKYNPEKKYRSDEKKYRSDEKK